MKSLNDEEIMVPNIPNSPVLVQVSLFQPVFIVYCDISSIAFSFSDLSPLAHFQKGNRGHFPNSSFLFKSTWSNLWKWITPRNISHCATQVIHFQLKISGFDL